MKLQNRVFFNEFFIPAFKKLMEFDLNAVETSNIVKSVKTLDEQQYAVMFTRDKLLQESATIGEQVVFKSEEDSKKFTDQMNDLLRDDFDIPLKEKIKLNKTHKICGNYLAALDDVVEVIDLEV